MDALLKTMTAALSSHDHEATGKLILSVHQQRYDGQLKFTERQRAAYDMLCQVHAENIGYPAWFALWDSVSQNVTHYDYYVADM